MPLRYELRCPACSAIISCDDKEMAARLRRVGKLRRAAEPELELLEELFKSAAGEWSCTACGGLGLTVRPAAEEEDEQWGGSRPCEACGKPIPAERVELFPHIKVCVTCQGKSESGQDLSAPEYCRRCGALMKMRQSRAGGVTRYVMTCSECGR